MNSQRHTFHWRPGDPGGDMQLQKPLAQRWKPLCQDRTGSARDIVLGASGVLRDWLMEVGAEQDSSDLAAMLGGELDALLEAHGWRAPVALWWRTIDRSVKVAADLGQPLREVLVEEMGLWLLGLERDASDPSAPTPHGSTFVGPWSGEPLHAGMRLPNRSACATALGNDMQAGEVLLIPSYSETVADCVEALVALGKAPEVILGEGGPLLGGRQMARRLERSGVPMRLVYDAALPGLVGQADRLWMGAESIGAASMLAPVGSRTLVQAAHSQGVPLLVLATTDKVMPGAELRLPAWGDQEGYLLWADSIARMQVESQPFETLSLSPNTRIATEKGLKTPAELAILALHIDGPSDPFFEQPDATAAGQNRSPR